VEVSILNSRESLGCLLDMGIVYSNMTNVILYQTTEVKTQNYNVF